MTGRTLGHYQVLDLLGSGGMGEVFKARDTRLNRLVAIKILRPERVSEDARKQRFIQEAQAASALNHPNIVTIHDIGQSDGTDFMVMEYVPGATLDARIPRQGMRLNEALRVAVQVAAGLARAHAAGIVHRDLKPSNIVIGEDGLVKILDFGLAKLTEQIGIGADEATLTRRLETEEGTVLGTTSYMSPEQAEGRKLDARTDVFSFGVVLYEMLTGRNPFARDTRLATMAATLKEEPEQSGNIPPDLDKIIRRCLRKDPGRRFQHMDDLRIALEEVREDSESGHLTAAVPPVAAPARPRWPWLLAPLAVLAAAAAGFLWMNRGAPQASYKLRPLTVDSGLTSDPAISPDGRLAAYASDRATGANLDIWVHPLTANAQPVRLTTHGADDYSPEFSADGGQIAFVSRREGGGIYVVPALGGQERLLVRGGVEPRYSPDGQWLAYSTSNNILANSQVFVMPASGGAPQRIGSEVPWAGFPLWSPDSQSLLFRGMDTVADVNSASLWRAPLGGGSAIRLKGVPIGAAGWHGKLLLLPRTNGLAAMDPDRPAAFTTLFAATGQVAGPRAAGDRIVFALHPSPAFRLWSVAMDHNSGKVLGPMEPVAGTAGSNYSPAMPFDGSKLLFTHSEPDRQELRMRDTASGQEAVLHVSPRPLRGKVAPDGAKVAFSGWYGGDTNNISLTDASGGEVAKLVEAEQVQLYGWTQDGLSLVYYQRAPIRWFTVDLATRGISALLTHQRLAIHGVSFSPDRRWLSFHTPGGTVEPVYIAPVQDGKVADENAWIRIAASAGTNRIPWWSPDGSILYYVSERDGFVCIWAQRLHPATKRPAGAPVPVIHFHGALRTVGGAATFGPAVSRDRLTFALEERSGNIWIAEKETVK